MLLKFDNISKKYRKKEALIDFTQELGPGIYALLGPNGAGKSTLMNILVGLLKPTSGAIYVDDVEIMSMGEEYRDMLGYLPQDPGFYSTYTGQGLLEYYASIKGVGNAGERINEVLEMVNLTNDAKVKVGKYSGGMKRRLGIALALMNDPKILVMDEPTAGLDPKERMRFRNIISQIGFDRIVIIATHIVSDIESICDTCILLKAGRVVAKGSATELCKMIEGKVWNMPATEEYAEFYVEKHACANIVKRDGELYVHTVSDQKPADNAVAATPELEDVYMYYFDESADGHNYE